MGRIRVKLRFKLVLLLGIILMVAAGCSSGDADEKDATNGESAEVADENVLTIAMPADLVSMDIHNHNSIPTEAVHTNMYNYLFRKNAEEEILPDLVEEYEIEDDYTWDMTIKEGVTFHNGDELTAADVKFTLERVANDESLREHSHYRNIEEVEVIDEYHFKIHTYEPEPILLNRLSRIGSGILPKDYIEEHGWDHFLENPIGSGPFQFVSWDRDSKIVLEPYEEYFDGAIEEWEQIVFRVIPEESTRIAELLTGGVDIISNVPDHEWNRIKENDGTGIESVPGKGVAQLLVRHNEEYPTSDPRVREAIDLAIDNKVLAEDVLGGAAIPVRSRVTPGNSAANEELYDTYLYDPERAKELLAEAGYPDGLEITIHGTSPTSKARDVQEMIAAMLGEVGITVNLDLMESSSFIEMRNAYSYEDMYFATFGNSMSDAMIGVDMNRSSRAIESHGYSNEEVDELIEKAEVNMDLDERSEQLERVQEIFAEDRPLIYLYNEVVNYGVNDRIDFTPRADGMYSIEDIVKK